VLLGELNVPIEDYGLPNGQRSVFFGDRDLNNPGYSTFDLSGTVGYGQADSKALDVWRVEQRLKYLAWPAFGFTSGVILDSGYRLNIPREFAVNGEFGIEEESALRGFYAATHYQYLASSNSNGFEDATSSNARTVSTASGADTNLAWLNAYNAPHWMNVYESFQIPYPAGQSGGMFISGQKNVEAYATSWTRDLLQAWRYSRDSLAQQGLVSGELRINGSGDCAPDAGACRG